MAASEGISFLIDFPIWKGYKMSPFFQPRGGNMKTLIVSVFAALFLLSSGIVMGQESKGKAKGAKNKVKPAE